MKKYLVTYHAPISAVQQMANNSPEEAQEGMKHWMAWAEQCGKNLVDMGTPLGNGQVLEPGGNSEDSTRQVCGYSILEAENIQHAKQMLQGHPHLQWDGACQIEVHEALPMPG